MNTLFDMLTGGHNRHLADHFATQFGLQQQAATKAIEALMPAFSQGLQRNVSTPQNFGEFMQALAQGNHINYLQNPAAAFTNSGMEEGNAILGHLFGSKAVSNQVAEQAALVSGVSSNILKQMLPALAPMVMGSLFQNMMNNGMKAQQAAANANPFGRILEELMKGGFGMPGGGMGGESSRQPPGSNNPIGDILEQMMGGGRRQEAPSSKQQAPSPADTPLGKIFEEMLKGGKSRGEGPLDRYEREYEQGPAGYDDDPYAHERTEPIPQSEPKGGGLEDLFGDMFKPAREVNQRYQESIESIFREFLGPRS